MAVFSVFKDSVLCDCEELIGIYNCVCVNIINGLVREMM